MAIGNRANVILMHLGHRNVNVKSPISFETVLLNVADNTYDFDRSRTCVVVVNTQLRANRGNALWATRVEGRECSPDRFPVELPELARSSESRVRPQST